MLLNIGSILSSAPISKTQWFIHLRCNLNLQLRNDISKDFKRFLRYFNGTVIVVFFKLSFDTSDLMFPNNLAFLMKNLKLLPSTIFQRKQTLLHYYVFLCFGNLSYWEIVVCICLDKSIPMSLYLPWRYKISNKFLDIATSFLYTSFFLFVSLFVWGFFHLWSKNKLVVNQCIKI